MEGIKRTGPPTPDNLDGDVFDWTIPLSGTPSDVWIRLFADPGEHSSACHPGGVNFSGRNASFRSAERWVPDWIRYIDGWMAKANEEYAKHVEQQRQRQAALLSADQERKRKIAEATDKFKDL